MKPVGRRRRARRLAVSVVVVVHNMPREASRTLYSLSAAHQKDIGADEYEVIVVDNGSDPPFDRRSLETLDGDFRLIRIDPAPPSPAAAVNRGLAAARGKVVGVLIDGARIATPGLIHFARHGASLHPHAVVTTLGWYLGHDFQRRAMASGYDQAREDALLAGIDWPANGYRLFEIATLDESSADGWFRPVAESNALFLNRRFWRRLGGMDERFASPGGGFVNLDTFGRALASPEAKAVILLGEGTFHQLHGGVATNSSPEEFAERLTAWKAEYEEVRGRPWSAPVLAGPPIYLGTLPRGVLPHFLRAAITPADGRRERALGAGFDLCLWGKPAGVPTDPVAAAVIELAHQELRAGNLAAATGIARILRKRFPDEPEALRLLTLAPSATDRKEAKGAAFHAALGDAFRLLGDAPRAKWAYQQAIAMSRDNPRSYVGLSLLRLRGEPYYDWLRRFYALPHVRTVLEIGIGDGSSLACVPPGKVAIGVDPRIDLQACLAVEAHLFPETSDAFFARRGPDAVLRGSPVDVGFIDGDHVFAQSLRDFINLERYCHHNALILIHDTLPLDEVTQRPRRERGFYTGDVWKLVPCLRFYRPELDVFTIATPSSGLTVVAGLDPASPVLSASYDEAVGRFDALSYESIEKETGSRLAVVPNSWKVVSDRLGERGIPVAEMGPAAGHAGGGDLSRADEDETSGAQQHPSP